MNTLKQKLCKIFPLSINFVFLHVSLKKTDLYGKLNLKLELMFHFWLKCSSHEDSTYFCNLAAPLLSICRPSHLFVVCHFHIILDFKIAIMTTKLEIMLPQFTTLLSKDPSRQSYFTASISVRAMWGKTVSLTSGSLAVLFS